VCEESISRGRPAICTGVVSCSTEPMR
jgi:hypothetical protein